MQMGHINAPRGHYPQAAQDSKPRWQPKPYTQGQADLIKTMMTERGITTDVLRTVFPSRPSSAADASKVIEWLKAQPRADQTCPYCGDPKGQLRHACRLMSQVKPIAKAAPNWDDIPDGNYAYEYHGKTHFYRVSRKAGRGKYAGRTFVNVQERASSVLYPVDDYKQRAAILHSIRENGPEACGLLFAERLGKCRFCFEDLTDEDNPYKSRGAGPVCGPKRLG